MNHTLLQTYRSGAAALKHHIRDISRFIKAPAAAQVQKSLAELYPAGSAIGVEIEFVPSDSPFFSARESFCCHQKPRSAPSCDYFDWKRDGSVHAAHGQVSEVNAFISTKFWHPLLSLCRKLKKHGARFNRSTAVHIHLDMRDAWAKSGGIRADLPVDRLPRRLQVLLFQRYFRLVTALPWLQKMTARHRVGRRYCRTNPPATAGSAGLNSWLNWKQGWSRYYAVNARPLFDHDQRTIEFRLLQGMCDFDRIKNWILLLRVLCYNGPACPSIADFAKHRRCTPELLLFVRQEVRRHRNWGVLSDEDKEALQ